MRRVVVDAVVAGVAPDAVFVKVIDFRRYAELAPHVETVTVDNLDTTDHGRSSWELRFRSGLLRWTEQESFLRDQGRIEFAQQHGDFEQFTGHWTLERDGTGTRVHFEAAFDFGISSLESILDPIAERVIAETVAWALTGLFDDVAMDRELDRSDRA
ncbi:MAG: SRPBCC family protein [Actinomycetia bacterium]|nr:SRPBCC family protein [Actinomycetes bacterium]